MFKKFVGSCIVQVCSAECVKVRNTLQGRRIAWGRCQTRDVALRDAVPSRGVWDAVTSREWDGRPGDAVGHSPMAMGQSPVPMVYHHYIAMVFLIIVG